MARPFAARSLFPLVVGFTLWAPRLAEAATCGNGTVEGAEACDDGNTSSLDGCSSTCVDEAGWDCNVANFGMDFTETLDSLGTPPIWSVTPSVTTAKTSLAL